MTQNDQFIVLKSKPLTNFLTFSAKVFTSYSGKQFKLILDSVKDSSCSSAPSYEITVSDIISTKRNSCKDHHDIVRVMYLLKVEYVSKLSIFIHHQAIIEHYDVCYVYN